MSTLTIPLGSLVKDLVTGLEGIAVSRVEYLTGCTQYGISRPVDADGKLPDAIYLDHARLQVLVYHAVAIPSSDTGGPQRDAPRH